MRMNMKKITNKVEFPKMKKGHIRVYYQKGKVKEVYEGSLNTSTPNYIMYLTGLEEEK